MRGAHLSPKAASSPQAGFVCASALLLPRGFRYLANAASEIEVALAVGLPSLRNFAAMIAKGDMAVPRRGEFVESAVEVVPPEPTEVVFTLRSIRWRDAKGVQKIADQYTDADLPLDTARRALSRGLVAPVSHPRRRELLNAHGGRHPNPNYAFDLDEEPQVQSAAPVAHDVLASADFRVIDRSKEARTIQIEVPRQ
jgi:hypothetical protein